MATPEDSYLVDQAPNGNSPSSGIYQVSTQTYSEPENAVVPAYQEPPPPGLYPVSPYSQPPPYYGSVQEAGQPHAGQPPQVITAVPATRQGRVPAIRNQYQEVAGVDLGLRDAIPPTTTFDRFCDACSCHVHLNCCTTSEEDHSLESRLLLRKARWEGWWMFWSVILPLIFSVQFVVIWIIIQLVLSIGLVALSAVAYADANDGHDVDQSSLIHLVVSCAFVLLSGIDDLLQCFIAKAWISASYKWSLTAVAMVRLTYTTICLYVASICDTVHHQVS